MKKPPIFKTLVLFLFLYFLSSQHILSSLPEMMEESLQALDDTIMTVKQTFVPLSLSPNPDPVVGEESASGYVKPYLNGIDKDIYRGLEKMETEYSFAYDGKISPEEILDKIQTTTTGTYYNGVYLGYHAEVSYNALTDQSYITIKTDPLHSQEQEAELNQQVDAILREIIADDMTDYEKIVTIYDYIIANSEYSYGDENSETPNGYSIYSPYGLLNDGMGVCQAYSLLYYKMLERVGIPAFYVTGQAQNSNYSGNHAWNMVLLYGNWYHVDITWGDPLPDIPGVVYYDYFLKSDQTFQKDHSWDREAFPSVSEFVESE